MYLNYCKGLKFDENPDYMYLRQLFRVLFRMNNHQYDFIYDWSTFKKDGKTDTAFSRVKPGHHTQNEKDHNANHHSGARKTAKSPGRQSHRKTPAVESPSAAFKSPSPGVSHKLSLYNQKFSYIGSEYGMFVQPVIGTRVVKTPDQSTSNNTRPIWK